MNFKDFNKLSQLQKQIVWNRLVVAELHRMTQAAIKQSKAINKLEG